MIAKIAFIKLVLGVVFISNVFAATIQLPQTGQTSCYDAAGNLKACAGTMQDGNIRAGVAWPGPRFSVGSGLKSSCVTDNLTGLIWSKNADPTSNWMTWQEALDSIIELNSNGGLCGYSDWRLPNINERGSLINYDKADMSEWLNGIGFSDVKIDMYWSSTIYTINANYAWFADMWNGKVDKNITANMSKVWPVRAGQSNSPDTNYPANISKTGQIISYYPGDDGELRKGVLWPSQRFIDNQDGTITDNLTGLMWLKDAGCFAGQKWQDSFDKVKDFNSDYEKYSCYGYKAGYNDWRLPNVKENFSLIDYLSNNPALPLNAVYQFVNLRSVYWSSTTFANKTASAWTLDIWDGNVQADVKDVFNFIWPVRSGVVAVNNNCMATLLSNLHMNIPVIVYGGLFYTAELESVQSTDGNIWFKVTRAEQISDTTPYNSCQAAVLSNNYKLVVPALSYGNVSYQANFEYAAGPNSEILFRLKSAQQN